MLTAASRRIDLAVLAELDEQSKVGYVITGDEDLLVIKAYKGIPIVLPRRFWEILRASQALAGVPQLLPEDAAEGFRIQRAFGPSEVIPQGVVHHRLVAVSRRIAPGAAPPLAAANAREAPLHAPNPCYQLIARTVASNHENPGIPAPF